MIYLTCDLINEHCTNGPAFRFGLAISRNLGASWTYCGDIANTKVYPADDIGANIGGGPIIMKDGYFYAYIDEDYGSGQFGMIVIRSPIDSVVAAAKSNKVTTWKKYAAGAWNTDPFTGCGTAVVSVASGRLADSHSSATYVRSTGTYLISINAQADHKLVVKASTDGLIWDNEYELQSGSGAEEMMPYSTWAGADGRQDQLEQNNNFWLYWDHKITNYNDDVWTKATVTATPKVYYWRVSAIDGSGTGSWSSVRTFTTKANISGGAVTSIELPNLIASHSYNSDVQLQRKGVGRLMVTFAASSGSRLAVSMHDTQGRLVGATIKTEVQSGKSSVEVDCSKLSAGRYLMRIKGSGINKTVPVAISR